MKILVIGTGAVGGYFGGRLVQAGRDVTFFVRPQRKQELASRGLQIRSPYGDFHLTAPATITANELEGRHFDLALLSCKAPDLEPIVAAFTPAIGKQTRILPLLNGMRHLDVLDERFGPERVLGGVAMISATRDVSGDIVQFTPLQKILFGGRSSSLKQEVPAILATLSNAGFPVEATDNILQDMWDKWVFIAVLAGITCLMRASIGSIEAAGAHDVTAAMLDEALAVAKANGFPTRPGPLENYRGMLMQKQSVLRASMLRDIENGATTEGTHVLGDLLARADRKGVEAPLLRLANFHVKCYELERRTLNDN
jgi:2-dehydropantoate 2-reductase